MIPITDRARVCQLPFMEYSGIINEFIPAILTYNICNSYTARIVNASAINILTFLHLRQIIPATALQGRCVCRGTDLFINAWSTP